ncbi:MAG: hypothetical protein QOF86_4261, partial [Baekduia sp.]|nr:hypothetical protein [Baekduia sp.]
MGRFYAAVAVALAMVASVALAASAQAASVVTQQREPDSHLIAQRFVAPATGPQTLTLVSQLSLGTQWSTITALDFDRDGRVDATVAMSYSPGQNDVVYAVRPVGAASTTTEVGGATCFAPKYAGTSPTSPS